MPDRSTQRSWSDAKARRSPHRAARTLTTEYFKLGDRSLFAGRRKEGRAAHPRTSPMASDTNPPKTPGRRNLISPLRDALKNASFFKIHAHAALVNQVERAKSSC